MKVLILLLLGFTICLISQEPQEKIMKVKGTATSLEAAEMECLRTAMQDELKIKITTRLENFVVKQDLMEIQGSTNKILGYEIIDRFQDKQTGLWTVCMLVRIDTLLGRMSYLTEVLQRGQILVVYKGSRETERAIAKATVVEIERNLTSQGCVVLCEEARQKSIAEIQEMLAIEKTDLAGNKVLFHPDYTVGVEVSLMEQIASAGLRKYKVHLNLTIIMTQVAWKLVPMQRIHDIPEIPALIEGYPEKFQAQLTQVGMDLGQEACKEAFYALRVQLLKYRLQDQFLVIFHGYQDIMEIRQALTRIPEVDILQMSDSTLGRTKIAVMRIRYTPASLKNMGGELCSQIYSLLKNLHDEKPQHYWENGSMIIFKK